MFVLFNSKFYYIKVQKILENLINVFASVNFEGIRGIDMEAQRKLKSEKKTDHKGKGETIYERLSRIAAEAVKNPSKVKEINDSSDDSKKPKKDLQHQKELSLHSYCNSTLDTNTKKR
jgi:hypothetical protein